MNQLYVFYRLNKEINDKKDKFSMNRFIKDIVKESMIINPGVEMTIDEEIRILDDCFMKLKNKNWIIMENKEFIINKKNRGVKEILDKMEIIEKDMNERIDFNWYEKDNKGETDDMEYLKNMYNMIQNEFSNLSLKIEQRDNKIEEWIKRQKSSNMEIEEKEGNEENEESSDEETDEYEIVKSSDKKKEYKVNVSRWTCNCPGFMYSRYNPPQCKHVYQVYIEKNKGKTDTSEFEKILQEMENKKR
jgi:hypothetical protein